MRAISLLLSVLMLTAVLGGRAKRKRKSQSDYDDYYNKKKTPAPTTPSPTTASPTTATPTTAFPTTALPTEPLKVEEKCECFNIEKTLQEEIGDEICYTYRINRVCDDDYYQQVINYFAFDTDRDLEEECCEQGYGYDGYYQECEIVTSSNCKSVHTSYSNNVNGIKCEIGDDSYNRGRRADRNSRRGRRYKSRKGRRGRRLAGYDDTRRDDKRKNDDKSRSDDKNGSDDKKSKGGDNDATSTPDLATFTICYDKKYVDGTNQESGKIEIGLGDCKDTQIFTCNVTDIIPKFCKESDEPTARPTETPTFDPTVIPTYQPTTDPTTIPTYNPTSDPIPTGLTTEPTSDPTNMPSYNPTSDPTTTDTTTATPTTAESTGSPPSDSTTTSPTTANPTSAIPTLGRSPVPDRTRDPTFDPTSDPTANPTTDPTWDPLGLPPFYSTRDPTTNPTSDPTFDPTADPTADPTVDPTSDPLGRPPFLDQTNDPTSDPSVDPTADPTSDPTSDPSADPTVDPTSDPTTDPSSDPTADPTLYPTTDPTFVPTFNPTYECFNTTNDTNCTEFINGTLNLLNDTFTEGLNKADFVKIYEKYQKQHPDILPSDIDSFIAFLQDPESTSEYGVNFTIDQIDELSEIINCMSVDFHNISLGLNYTSNLTSFYDQIIADLKDCGEEFESNDSNELYDELGDPYFLYGNNPTPDLDKDDLLLTYDELYEEECRSFGSCEMVEAIQCEYAPEDDIFADCSLAERCFEPELCAFTDTPPTDTLIVVGAGIKIGQKFLKLLGLTKPVWDTYKELYKDGLEKEIVNECKTRNKGWIRRVLKNVKTILGRMMSKRFGVRLTQKFKKRFAAKVLAKLGAKFFPFIGWAIIAWDLAVIIFKQFKNRGGNNANRIGHVLFDEHADGPMSIDWNGLKNGAISDRQFMYLVTGICVVALLIIAVNLFVCVKYHGQNRKKRKYDECEIRECEIDQ